MGLLDRLRQQQEELKASGGVLPKAKKEKPEESEEAKAARLAKIEERERARAAKLEAQGKKSEVEGILGILWDAPIEFKPNAKPAESTSGKRYHAYSAAKTLKEAQSLGASKADLRWDISKGYITSEASNSKGNAKSMDAVADQLADGTTGSEFDEKDKESCTPPQKRKKPEPGSSPSKSKVALEQIGTLGKAQSKKAKLQAQSKNNEADGLGGIAWDEPIEFHPDAKPADSVSGKRYHVYCVAKTLKEAQSLGASRADLRWDISKKYIKSLLLASKNTENAKGLDAKADQLADTSGDAQMDANQHCNPENSSDNKKEEAGHVAPIVKEDKSEKSIGKNEEEASSIATPADIKEKSSVESQEDAGQVADIRPIDATQGHDAAVNASAKIPEDGSKAANLQAPGGLQATSSKPKKEDNNRTPSQKRKVPDPDEKTSMQKTRKVDEQSKTSKLAAAAADTDKDKKPRKAKYSVADLEVLETLGTCSGDGRIEFIPNGKTEASHAKSYQRYEQYAKAKTFQEALDFGAMVSDIQYDFQKGFLKILTQGSGGGSSRFDDQARRWREVAEKNRGQAS